MDPNILLRKAVSGDIESIKAILFSSLKEYGIELPDDYLIADIESIGLKAHHEIAFVLAKDEIVIGFFILRPIAQDCIELKRMYLTRTERGQRLGEYLLDHAINFARENNYRCVRLETTSRFAEAVSLYKKHGFRVLKGVDKAPGHDLAFEKMIE